MHRTATKTTTSTKFESECAQRAIACAIAAFAINESYGDENDNVYEVR